MQVRAAIVDAPGLGPRVGTADLPPSTPGTTLIEVIAAPLNPLDLLIASGNFHSARHESAYVPGSECVGTVIESGTFAVGSLVYAECHASPTNPGAFARQVRVSDVDILPVPEGVSPIASAAIGNSGVAAYLPLVDVAGLRAGETVLVLGATGAVGQVAIQIAHLMGAGRVIGVARDGAALSKLPSLGADAVVALREDESVDELGVRLREAAGSVDVVLDCLYGHPLEAALQACAQHARVVNVGHSAGPLAAIPAGLLRGAQITLTGFAGVHVPLRDKRVALSWLWGALASGRISVAVNSIPLEDLPSAWSAQAASPHAKYVVVPSGAQ
ncbi:MAG TPA: zinc-binding dehydrogenase [Galbitalea sp.]|nr:zinc-binding dehydrogenase [Galbitalea sp.]